MAPGSRWRRRANDAPMTICRRRSCVSAGGSPCTCRARLAGPEAASWRAITENHFGRASLEAVRAASDSNAGGVPVSPPQKQNCWVQTPPGSAQIPQLSLQQTWPSWQVVSPHLTPVFGSPSPSPPLSPQPQTPDSTPNTVDGPASRRWLVSSARWLCLYRWSRELVGRWSRWREPSARHRRSTSLP